MNRSLGMLALALWSATVTGCVRAAEPLRDPALRAALGCPAPGAESIAAAVTPEEWYSLSVTPSFAPALHFELVRHGGGWWLGARAWQAPSTQVEPFHCSVHALSADESAELERRLVEINLWGANPPVPYRGRGLDGTIWALAGHRKGQRREVSITPSDFDPFVAPQNWALRELADWLRAKAGLPPIHEGQLLGR